MAEDYEPQRALGFPLNRRPGEPRRPGDEEGLFAPPSTWGPRDLDMRWARHPARWLRWRLRVRRLGPYAPDFDEKG